MHKKQIILGSMLILLAAVPATLLLSEQPQETRSRATASTTLSFAPNATADAPLQKNVGDPVDVDVIVSPGSNLPSLIKLEMAYDSTIFQPATTSFTVNTTAFPTTVEGPVVLDGKVLISVSIGSDSTKAVQVPTKVGTLHLITKASTNDTAAQLTFGSRSQVLSLARNDEATENVLSTTTPSYISVNQSISPTTTVVAVSPTVGVTSVPTPTSTVSATTAPTPTINPSATTLSFDILMHGIGNSGDNANPTASALSNKEPKTPSRDLTVYVYNSQNQLAATKSATATYDPASGSFKAIVDMGNAITQGDYTVRVKENLHLRRLVPGIQRLAPQTTNVMPVITLVAGDVNNDNTLNILDYNVMVGCYSDLLPPIACTDTNKVISDLTDDGNVNQFDYNLFLREITVQSGN